MTWCGSCGRQMFTEDDIVRCAICKGIMCSDCQAADIGGCEDCGLYVCLRHEDVLGVCECE